MKQLFEHLPITASPWTGRLKVLTLIFAILSVVFSGVSLFLDYTIPGASPICIGFVMLLLGIRLFNMYME